MNLDKKLERCVLLWFMNVAGNDSVTSILNSRSDSLIAIKVYVDISNLVNRYPVSINNVFIGDLRRAVSSFRKKFINLNLTREVSNV